MPQTVAVQPKAMLESKTFYFNLVIAGLTIISEIQAMLPAFADILVIPQDVARWTLFGTAVVNIVLRRVSDQPARFAPAEPVKVEKFDGSAKL